MKSRKSPEQFFEAVRQEEVDSATLMRMPELSGAQREALEKIGEFMEAGSKPVLLHGVAGSGKTEVYVSLALEELKKGKVQICTFLHFLIRSLTCQCFFTSKLAFQYWLIHKHS